MDSVITEHESKKLRRTLGCFATGVAVVTTKDEDTLPSGMTINSFSSVSLEPPLILWSLSLESARLDIFQQAEYFAINILAAISCIYASISRRPNLIYLPMFRGSPLHMASLFWMGWSPAWNAVPGNYMRAAIILLF